jgi:hypothetical protein
MSIKMNKNTNAETRVAEGYDIPSVEAWISENTITSSPLSFGRALRADILI